MIAPLVDAYGRGQGPQIDIAPKISGTGRPLGAILLKLPGLP